MGGLVALFLGTSNCFGTERPAERSTAIDYCWEALVLVTDGESEDDPTNRAVFQQFTGLRGVRGCQETSVCWGALLTFLLTFLRPDSR